MNELLPIIRRARRPLVVVDAPPVVVGNVAPVEVVVPPVPVKPVVNELEPQSNDAQVASKRSAR
jgi:hypothetical protein